MAKTFNVLFLSQRNSARSIMAEALLNSMSGDRFHAYSAGVRPEASVDPVVLELLDHARIPRAGLRAKHYREFTGRDAPTLDFVFTLSDTAAGESVPVWPGLPVTAHWRSRDPMHFDAHDPQRRLALIRARGELERRLRVFANLPLDSLDRLATQTHVDEIGRAHGEDEPSGAV